MANGNNAYGTVLHLNKNTQWNGIIQRWKTAVDSLDKTQKWNVQVDIYGTSSIWKNREDDVLKPITWDNEIDWDILSGNPSAKELLKRSQYKNKINPSIMKTKLGMVYIPNKPKPNL